MAKKSALTFGIIFLVVGIWGFIQTPILGVFDADGMHSVVHLIFGVVLTAVALWASAKSAVTLKVVGILYIIVAIWGFFSSPVLGFINVNAADNWLHLVLGIVIAAFGFAAKEGSVAAPTASAPQM